MKNYNKIIKKIVMIGLILLLIVTSFASSFTEISNSIFIETVTDDVDWWPMFRHDLNHSGFSTSLAPNTNRIILSALGLYHPNLVITDNRLYKGINCYTTGLNPIWSNPTHTKTLSTPAVNDGRLYVGSYLNSQFYCLDSETGEILWQTLIGDTYRSSPAVFEDMVYVGTETNKLYCLNRQNGEVLWNFTTGDAIRSSPAIAEGKVYFGSRDDNVYSLNVYTGQEIWRYTTNGDVDSSPAIYDNRVYVGGGNRLYCLNAENGNYLGSNWIGYLGYSSPAIAYGNVYVASYRTSGFGRVYCFNAETGQQIWSYGTDYDLISSVIVADGKAYFTGIGGDWNSWHSELICVNAFSGGDEIWYYLIHSNWNLWGVDYSATPVIADNKLYACFEEGQWDGSYRHYIKCFQDNYPPETPHVPIGPCDGIVGVEYTFSSYSTDLNGDDLFYWFDWGDGTNTSWLGPYTSAEIVYANHNWILDGNYSIRVKAKDSESFESDWSEPSSINISGNANTSISIEMIPDDPPVIVNPGETFTYTGILANNLDELQITDVWIMLDVPGYGMFGPICGLNNVYLPRGTTLTFAPVTQYVPTYAIPGLYRYIAFCGEYSQNPDNWQVIDSAEFTFTVTSGTADNGTGFFDVSRIGGWYCKGWT